MSKFKLFLFTHDDLDGAGCRIIFDLAYGRSNRVESLDIWNCSNANIDNKVAEAIDTGKVSAETIVWFADISASREMLNRIQDAAKEVWVVDHHRTNFFVEHELRQPGHAIIVPENPLGQLQSGTSLLYKKLCELAMYTDSGIYNGDLLYGSRNQQDLIGDFVDTVRSYDTYEWKQTGNQTAKELNLLFSLLGMERFCQMYLGRMRDSKYSAGVIGDDSIRMFIDAKLENEQRAIDKFTPADVITTTVRGYRTALRIGSCYPANVSELANQFLTKYPEFDIFVLFTVNEGGRFDFRTVRDDINLGEEIALPMGGGGHPKAAGAPLCQEIKDIFSEYVIAEMNGEIYDPHG